MAIAASNMALVANERQAVSLAFQAQTLDGTDQAGGAYSFASQAIGTAALNRYVIVGVWWFPSAGGSVTSVTVGGITATQLATLSNTETISIYAALVPTGTTATIAVSGSAAAIRCGIAVWSAVNTTGTASSTNSSTAVAPSAAVTVPPYGAVVSIAYDTNTGTFSWTNLTKNADAQVETQTFSCASDMLPTLNASRTVTATGPGGTRHAMIIAALPSG